MLTGCSTCACAVDPGQTRLGSVQPLALGPQGSRTFTEKAVAPPKVVASQPESPPSSSWAMILPDVSYQKATTSSKQMKSD